jgi:opacity protein-like surface antigen
MRRRKILLAAALLVICGAAAATASAQDESYTSSTDEYVVELPSRTWKAMPRADTVHSHTEFVYGERSDGFLQIRKEVLDAGAGLSDLARGEQDMKLRYRPGFVGGKEERFSGRLSGIVSTYEYTSAGRPMAGRIYYLKADGRTVYVLHFTGRSERLQRIVNQTDAIARSFRLK